MFKQNLAMLQKIQKEKEENLKMKRVAIFLDGSNLFYTQKKLGWNIDAEKLLDHCKGYG